MNTKIPESNKNKIPRLIRSDEWTITEKTEDHVAAVCRRNKLDERFIQQSSLIQTMSNTIKQQNQIIKQQNQIIKQQNKKIDRLNNQVQNLLHAGMATDTKTVNKENKTVNKIVYDLKKFYKNFNSLNAPIFDVLLAAYLLSPDSKDYSIEKLAQEYGIKNIQDEINFKKQDNI